MGVFLLLFCIGPAGCQGERWSSVVEKPSAEGRWRIDGTLIRSYNVSLQQAYESIFALADKNQWIVTDAKLGGHTADVRIKTTSLVEIEFSVWAPPNSSTDIGVEYAGGDKVGSTRVLDELERILPGKRITVNQPQSPEAQ